MDSVNWPKYLTTWNFCDFLISNLSWICQITNLRANFPLKWNIWMNLVSYCIHIVSILYWFWHSILLFVYLCYVYIIWICKVLTDQNISPCKSCDFLISKMIWFCNIIKWRVHFPLKWNIWINLVSYFVHIVSTL